MSRLPPPWSFLPSATRWLHCPRPICGWPYAAWILVAPVLSFLPIAFVSPAISASPLSIKFLLGGQLQTAIREQSAMVLHVREPAPPSLPASRAPGSPTA
jgi:hypothetical protein